MITHQRLLEILSYDPETGEFRWKINKGKMLAGSKAGSRLNDKYNQLTVDRHQYSGHALAWFYMTGEWRPETIDHKNHSDGDKFSNLRLATTRQNAYNKAPKPNSHSKWKGVTFDPGRKKCWKMAFKMPDDTRIQRRYENEREAAEDYIFLALEHHGEFARFE